MSGFRPTENLADKRILFTGCTGFVGKVTLSLLLRRVEKIRRIYALIRPPVSGTGEDRFWKKVVPSPALDPLRDRHGAGLEPWLRERVAVIDGDVVRPNLGLSPEALAQLERDGVDLVLHCAGEVAFNPPLDQGLNINALGVKQVAALAKRLGASVVHISTCFVVGERDGEVWEHEDESIVGYFPKRGTLSDCDFSPERELEDCQRLIQEVRRRSEDAALASRFRKQASDRILEDGGNPDDERTLRVAMARERKQWVADELRRAGQERAKHWGWPNVYCYAKSLGEQFLVASGIPHAIVRPAIVESALAFPSAGWNEGFTTSAPLAFVSLKGQRLYPAKPGLSLDLIPVDMVASGIVMVAAATVAGQQRQVYQLGSSDSNPLTMEHTVELLGLYKRQHFKQRTSGNRLWNALQSRLESIPVSRQRYELETALRNRALSSARAWCDTLSPRWGAPRVSSLIDRTRERIDETRDRLRKLEEMFDLYMPFIYEHPYVFRSDHIRELRDQLSDDDRQHFTWEPESIDWRHYWIDVHMEGLKKWIFPSLEHDLERKPRRVYQYRDLTEMFETSTRRFGSRVAMRWIGKGGRIERTTYTDLHALTLHAAGVLRAMGVEVGDRVMLMSENRPEWAMAYFAVLKIGASCVPIDKQATPAEVQNLAQSSRARVAIASEACAVRFDGVNVPILRLHELYGDTHPIASLGTHSPKPDDVASILFTSGTTGKPKGVMLTHRNFASLLAKLASLFDIGARDGALSVLPLHHTFEFTCGLLMPLSRGAEITYLEEVTPDALRHALRSGRISLLVGVPALWQALERGVFGKLGERSPWAEQLARALAEGLNQLRDRSGWNLGKLVFLPVHVGFGGRLRYLISGGSALPSDVFKTFSGMGFSVYEGYGLTESAPVLAVNRPGKKLRPGTVGEPLPGVDVVIDSPDADGVGEVVARGPNVMLGYFENPEATREVVDKGWLRTGDLGKFDESGRLLIVGRQKDVIIDLSGKNVYPDEVEALYRDCPYLKELSVVGLPDDAGGEKVAALVTPNYEAKAHANNQEDLSRDDVRRRLLAHFRDVSASLPYFRRIKIVHLRDADLPRTATQKVKRRQVVEELKRLERTAKAANEVRHGATVGNGVSHVAEILASLTGKDAASIGPETRLVEDLGFDSLMYTELLAALERAGVAVPDTDDITGIRTVEELSTTLGQGGRRGPAQKLPTQAVEQEQHERVIPEPLRALGVSLLGRLQRFSYESLLNVTVTGQTYIPQNTAFIVAANHTSHLDMGLVKNALGPFGRRIVTLAARDYFFEGWRKQYFENFTNLLPMERQGAFKESLRIAGEAIRQGNVVLIFPEGTRSPNGVLQEFKPAVGYLALAHAVPVLPMWLEGTHQAMPKGAMLPRRRSLQVRIGPAITPQRLRQVVETLPKAEHNRATTRLVEQAVRALAEGKVLTMEQPPSKVGSRGHEDTGNGRNRLSRHTPGKAAVRKRKQGLPRSRIGS